MSWYDDDNHEDDTRKLEREYEKAETNHKERESGGRNLNSMLSYSSSSFIEINIVLKPDSDVKGMRRIVEQCAKNIAMDRYYITWDCYSEISQFTFGPELLHLFKAIGRETPRIRRLNIDLPLAIEDMLAIVRALREEDITIEYIHLGSSMPRRSFDFLKDDDDDSSNESTQLRPDPQKDELSLLQILYQVSQWKCLRELDLEHHMSVGADFLEDFAELLPAIDLTSLCVRVRGCSDTFEATPESGTYMVDSKAIEAMKDLELAIQKNVTLLRLNLGLTVGSDDGKPLDVINNLNETFNFFCYLNACGRKNFLSSPQHHETWLARLGDVNELLRGGGGHVVNPALDDEELGLSAFYYYLRMNSWLFKPPKDLLAEITSLRKALAEKEAELETTKKRHQSELESNNKRHKAELLQANVQRLISQRGIRGPMSAAVATTVAPSTVATSPPRRGLDP